MSGNTAHTAIIENAIPTRYDPRVTVKPCEPARIPSMPLDILYQIARALPQPKQVFNLALASKDTWEYLQPALYECEVTYESRLSHKYGGGSSTSLEQHYGNYEPPPLTESSVEDGSWMDYDSGHEDDPYGDVWGNSVQSGGSQHGNDSEDEDEVPSDGSQNGDDWEGHIQSEDGDRSEWDFATEALQSHPDSRSTCPGRGILGECDECDRRISLQKRIFEAPLPETVDPLHIDGAMTALHWAAKKGASALPVAQKAIRSALAHQPSYINGVDLQERSLRDRVNSKLTRYIPVDLPPPLFLAVAHGNFEVFRALLDAGCAVNLLQGQSVYGEREIWGCGSSRKPIMSFKIHEECMPFDMDEHPCICEWGWGSNYKNGDVHYDEPNICQTVGHIAVRYAQPEMLQVLLQRGLNIQPPQPKSLKIIQFAVRQGSLAALKILLDHDPSGSHSHPIYGTLLHSVRYIGRNADRDARDELMSSMISFLLEHGTHLEARTDGDGDFEDTLIDGWEQSGLTALQSALLFTTSTKDPKFLMALHAAEAFVRMGANWNQCIDPTRSRSDSILRYCLHHAVEKSSLEDWYFREGDEEYTDKRREIRMAWGRVLKAIIETAGEPRSLGDSKNKAAGRAFSSLFSHLVNSLSNRDVTGWSDGCCPWAARDLGRMLLSAGIKPSDKDLKKWRVLRSSEGMRG